ncbi:MAG: phosphoesterase PA-phosphatase related protein [Candidatus Eremiobacteraeota bacterium]|nr:phosphoesterase PA-phosphatase related protein [Candidatus Eremiobacteraeota bacterium]
MTRTALRLAVAAACVVIAITLAHEVHEGQPIGADTAIMEAMHRHATPALDALAHGLTSMGNPIPLTVITVCAAAVLAAYGRRREAVMLVIGVIAATLLDTALKEVFERVRPHLWPRAPVAGDSFPSGHALTSPVAFGAMAVFAGRLLPRYARTFTVIAALLVAGIAWSRVYIGVHWPTDVIAGVSIGYLCLMVLLRLSSR